MKTQNKKLIFKCLDWLFDVEEPLHQLMMFVFYILVASMIRVGFAIITGDEPVDVYIICGIIVIMIYFLVIKAEPKSIFLIAWFFLLGWILFNQLWLGQIASGIASFGVVGCYVYPILKEKMKK